MNFVSKKLNFSTRGICSYLSTSLICICLSGCQLTDFYTPEYMTTASANHFGEYYLSLKMLSESELLDEINEQKSQDSIAANVKLILLHSLPTSPIHNAYTAKSLLNEHLKMHDSYQFNLEDEAFIALLKDQLNQQLFLFQKVISQDLEHDAESEKYQTINQKQKHDISTLKSTVEQLTKQITQLKKIEKSISEHGQ